MPDQTQQEDRRVQLDLTIEQAHLLREGLMDLADQDGGRRSHWLSLHEQILGALSNATQTSAPTKRTGM